MCISNIIYFEIEYFIYFLHNKQKNLTKYYTLTRKMRRWWWWWWGTQYTNACDKHEGKRHRDVLLITNNIL